MRLLVIGEWLLRIGRVVEGSAVCPALSGLGSFSEDRCQGCARASLTLRFVASPFQDFGRGGRGGWEMRNWSQAGRLCSFSGWGILERRMG